ncbi:hypothetical protein WN73_38465 [Bradyrhizobium sp. CCBAU 45394]|uniref:hypothetical protein n=1 Tax=Bradyrhizobium sp. CCBAU 45394 TaxID=1325087 RepID=UPI0023048213|nr:hypothetical protein [Bradyrhizobium sp. CCBAU 45394]MDA9396398.1 hypothetical protein [Bradyrhizobium sp. CCBAU 45394]
MTHSSIPDLLKACAAFVPVNLPLDVAIELHRTATKTTERSSNGEGGAVARFALQAVLFAATPTAGDIRRQLDYASALPIEAWEWPGKGADSTREQWLRGMSRCLTLITAS